MMRIDTGFNLKLQSKKKTWKHSVSDEDERPVSTMKQGLEAIQKASDFATVYAKKLVSEA